MEHLQHNIQRKRERHFRNKRSILGYALILFAICFSIPLAILWPQYFSVVVFDSRLSYHLIIDIEDYFTCDKTYQDFVVYKPYEDDSLMTMYVFNITNAQTVFERGYKPHVSQTGPYGFQRNIYKYDISFDTEDSLTVKFKEYSILLEVAETRQFVDAFITKLAEHISL